jgi:hypothetical protein
LFAAAGAEWQRLMGRPMTVEDLERVISSTADEP